MSQLRFGIVISAHDDSPRVFRGFLQGVQGIARAAAKPITIPLRIASAGMGFLRDINLGLRPLIDGIDGLVERGARLAAVRQNFERLSGFGGAQVELLARRVQNASDGVLRLSDSMAIYNRAVGAGLGSRDIFAAVEFGARKAAAVGEDTRSVIEGIINDLSRGSGRTLELLGIRTSMDGVKKDFEAIKGSGAFDQLTPAAQNAEFVRRAVAEMRHTLPTLADNKLGNAWQAMKTQVGDAAEKLSLVVLRSKAMQDLLMGGRGFLSGISDHFEKGGTFGELLLGKKDSKSGGLLGVFPAILSDLKSGLLALGRPLGAEIGEGIKGALAGLADTFRNALAFGGKAPGAAGALGGAMDVAESIGSGGFLGIGLGSLGLAGLLKFLRRGVARIAARTSGAEAAEAAGGAAARIGGRTAIRIGADMVEVAGGKGMGAASDAALRMMAPTEGVIPNITGFAGEAAPSFLRRALRVTRVAGRGLGVVGMTDLGVMGEEALIDWLWARNQAQENADYVRMNRQIRARSMMRGSGRMQSSGMGFIPRFGIVPFGPMLGMAAMGGDQKSHFSQWLEDFGVEYMGRAPSRENALAEEAVKRQETRVALRGRMRLRPQARINLERRLEREERMAENLREGRSAEGLRLRAEAAAAARQDAIDAHRAGFNVTRADRARFMREELDKRLAGPTAKAADSAAAGGETLRLDALIGKIGQLVAALMGDSAAVAAVGR